VITIELYDSCLAFYNYTFTRTNPYTKITRNSCAKLEDGAAKLIGIDYDVDSEDELADLLGDDVS
jgi:hypothetical protein